MSQSVAALVVHCGLYFESRQCVFILKETLIRLYIVLFYFRKMLIESDDSLDSFEEVVNSVVFVR